MSTIISFFEENTAECVFGVAYCVVRIGLALL